MHHFIWCLKENTTVLKSYPNVWFHSNDAFLFLKYSNTIIKSCLSKKFHTELAHKLATNPLLSSLDMVLIYNTYYDFLTTIQMNTLVVNLNWHLLWKLCKNSSCEFLDIVFRFAFTLFATAESEIARPACEAKKELQKQVYIHLCCACALILVIVLGIVVCVVTGLDILSLDYSRVTPDIIEEGLQRSTSSWGF